MSTWKEPLSRALTSFLLSLGFTWTILGVTGLTGHVPLTAASIAFLTVLLTVAASGKKGLILSGGAMGLIGAAWLVNGGLSTVTEVVNALIWHMSGLTAALPLVGASFAVIVSVMCAVICFFVSQRSAGPYPAMLLMMIAGMLLWLGGFEGVLFLTLPAVLGCVLLLLRMGDEQVGVLRVLPLAVCITLIGYTGVAAGGVTYQPLKDFAEEIRQRIMDTFFYTAPRDVFSLASEGWYPQGQGQLGGPAEPHTQPVMAVTTPRKAYLRGAIKGTYTGRNWEDAVSSRRYLWQSGSYRDLRAATFDEEKPTTGQGSELLNRSRVTVRMLGDSASSLFVPQRVRSLTTEGDLISYFNVSSEVFATRNLTVGDQWTADAPLLTSAWRDLPTLVNRSDDPDDPHWDDVRKTWLQLPDHLDERIWNIAQEAASGAETPYAQALAIQNYLSASFSYTLDAPEQNPNQDFVSTFLLLEKRGYCVHFASAMTVLCRMMGLPARYVEGYVALPDETGLAVVTGEQGHAWTEVYFRGFGWVTFDATPGGVTYTPPEAPDNEDEGDSPEPESSPEPTNTPEPTATPTPTPSPTPSPTPDAAQAPQGAGESTPTPSPTPEISGGDAPNAIARGKNPPGRWWWLIAAALIALRAALANPAIQAKRAKTRFRRWLIWTQAVHDGLRLRGLTRAANETPGAFFRRVHASGVDLRDLAEAESLMFYGHADPTDEEIDQAKAAFHTVRGTLKWYQRLGLFALRFAVPGNFRDLTRA